jgi:hypothetical protein
VIVKQLYILFIGILLALFVGVGIAAFYPSPTPHAVVYPPIPVPPNDKGMQNELFLRNQKDMQQYQISVAKYNRNVSIIALIGAIIFLSISFIFLAKIVIFSDGFTLGSLFTLIYSIIRGFGSEDSRYRFIVVTISLFIALWLGYVKFLKNMSHKKT